MFVSDEMLASVSEKYGQPAEKSFRFDCTAEEYERIKSSQKNGRNHDVTLYIRKDSNYIVNAKHFYPEGLYRSLSGGINPGEDFETGAQREAREETGCEIKLVKFLLRTSVQFIQSDSPEHIIDWRSFVFLADYTDGDFDFSDTNEIREVAEVSLEAFDDFSKIMLSLNIAGLRYRAALHDEVKKLLPIS